MADNSSFDWSGLAKTAVVSGSGILDNFINRAYYRNLQQKVWDREDSAMQRRVADLEKAGLSPALALGGQGSGTSIVSQTPSNMSASIAQGFDTYERSVSGRSLRELQKAQENLLKKQEEQADELHEKQLAKIQAEIDALSTNSNANLINAYANSSNAETNKNQYGLKVEENERQEVDFTQKRKEIALFGMPVSELPGNVKALLNNPVNYQTLEVAFNKLTKSGSHASLSSSESQVYRDFVDGLAQSIIEAQLKNDETQLRMTLSKIDTVLKTVNTATNVYNAIDASLDRKARRKGLLKSLMNKFL